MFFSGSALPIRMSASGPDDHRAADFQTDRREDVALLAVGIVQQRDTRRAVRIVFDRRDLRRNAGFVALEIDHRGKLLLVTAADEAAGDAAAAVAAAGLALADDQRLFRRLLGDVLARHHRCETARRGCRTICLYRPWLRSPCTPASFRPPSSRTYAFFQSERYPEKRPRRRSLPALLTVRTSATFTLNTFWTAP